MKNIFIIILTLIIVSCESPIDDAIYKEAVNPVTEEDDVRIFTVDSVKFADIVEVTLPLPPQQQSININWDNYDTVRMDIQMDSSSEGGPYMWIDLELENHINKQMYEFKKKYDYVHSCALTMDSLNINKSYTYDIFKSKTKKSELRVAETNGSPNTIILDAEDGDISSIVQFEPHTDYVDVMLVFMIDQYLAYQTRYLMVNFRAYY